MTNQPDAQAGSGDEPRWELLPSNPLAFFELEPGFERKQLKRAYNRWLRRFKPERFPTEFGRIRAAYEQLEEQLRFGEGTAGPQFQHSGDLAPAAQVETGGEARTKEPTPRAEAQPVREPDLDATALLAEHGPEFLRAALRERDDKSPAEWISLALVEDALNGDDPLALHSGLSDAVLATQGAKVVANLLVAACREPLDTRDASRLVQRILPLVRSAGREQGFDPAWYYFVTGTQWLNLAAKAKAADVIGLLERCREKVGPEGDFGYLVLLTRMLRRLSYRAEEGWLVATTRFLGENFQHLPPIEQEELDQFLLLHEYRKERAAFTRVHPFRSNLDAALIAITQGDEPLADRMTLAALTACLDQPEELCEAFPHPSEEDPSEVLRLFLWYADEVAERYGQPYVERLKRLRLREFLFALQRRTDRSWSGRLWSVIAYVFLFGFILVAILPWSIPQPESTGLQVAWWAAAVGVPVAVAAAFYTGGFARLRDRLTFGLRSRMYDSTWRPAALQFLRDEHISFPDFLDALVEVDEEDINVDGHLLMFAREDPALYLFASANRFQG